MKADLQDALATVDAQSMPRQKRLGDRRRAPRFETRLWVGIPEAEGEPDLEKCVISASGLLLQTRRDAGSVGAVRMLRLVTADLSAGINIMGHVARVIETDDPEKGRVLEATCFEFLPHDPQELEDFLRQVLEGEILVAPSASLEHGLPVQMDRRQADLDPDGVEELSVSGMVIDTNHAVEVGAKISLEIEGSCSDRSMRVSGQVVRSQPAEGFGDGERYCVEVSFGQSEQRMASNAAAIMNTLVSEAATTDRPSRKREGVHLSGRLSEVALPSLLAFLELERSSGVLGIERDSNKVAIIVQDGRILDVESDALESSPIAFLAELLEWHEGVFEFSFQAVERDDAIGLSTTALLMECARISDERSR